MTAGRASSNEATFIVCSWDATNKKVITTETSQNCIMIEGENNEWQGIGEKGKVTYYAVEGRAKRKTLNVFGEVHLVLMDGAELTCTGGVKVEKDNEAKLHIHSYSKYEKYMGKLTVTNSYKGAAGIGTGSQSASGDIIIHGGNIHVTGGNYGAGIGGSLYSGVNQIGDIVIFGGIIDAQGGDSGAGIGAGSRNDESWSGWGNIYFYGGDVKAKGGDLAAGVGGGGNYNPSGLNKRGLGGKGSNVKVYGGKLTAQGGRRAAGIGTGSSGTGDYGDRIRDMYYGNVDIDGGEVYATGGDYGAGIGGGCNVKCRVDDRITINGGKVVAKGGKNGAGIGGGEDGSSFWVNIINGGEVYATGGENAAGIGSGYRGYCHYVSKSYWEKDIPFTFQINGGKVVAKANDGGSDSSNATRKDGASAIGCGTSSFFYTGKKEVQISFGNDLKVTAGKNEKEIDRTFTAGERCEACKWRSYACIEKCDHSNSEKYEYIDENNHRHFCTSCKSLNVVEKHDIGTEGNTHDCVCGKKYSADTDLHTLYILQAKADGSAYDTDKSSFIKVIKDHDYILPEPVEIPGMIFQGYYKNDGIMEKSGEGSYVPNAGKIPTSIEMPDELSNNLEPAGSKITPTTNAAYVAYYRTDYKAEWTWNIDYENPQAATASVTITNTANTEDTKTLQAVKLQNISKTPTAENPIGETGIVLKATYEKLAGVTYNFYDWKVEKYFFATEVEFDASASDNSKVLEDNDDRLANVTMTNMTLKKDGKLHALCLPFSARISDTPLNGATIYGITNAEIVGTQLQMKFTPVTDYIEAGMPYFVKLTSGSDVNNPVFKGVCLKNQTIGMQNQFYEFCGTYNQWIVDDDNMGLTYILQDGNQLVQSDVIEGFSNYFLVTKEKKEDGSHAIQTVQLNLNDEVIINKRVSFGLDGEGTEKSPYIIKTVQNLKDMAAAFNGTDVTDLKDKYFQQKANVTFNKETENNFTPVNSFTGHYDGNGFLLSGLNINAAGSANAALFLNLADGSSVKNVILKNSTFTGSTAGAIAVSINGTTNVENCHVLKDVTVKSNNSYAGGIVAYMSSGTPTVKDCSSHAQVTALQSYAGGIVASPLVGTVSNCIYLGNSITANASNHAFAVAGNDGGKITNSYFTAPTLTDANAKLMPQSTVDNTDFLTMLKKRDEFVKTAKTDLTASDISYDITLNGHTLYKDNTWNTLYLPFTIENIAGTPLEGATVKQLTNSNYKTAESQLELIFNTPNYPSRIGVGEIYFVKWEGTTEVKDPTFTGVTINYVNNVSSNFGLGDVCGTLKPVTLEANDKTKLFMGAQNKMYYPNTDVTINSFHAYIQLSSAFTLDDLNVNNGVRSVVLNFGDGEVTGIDVRSKMSEVRGEYYDLSGRRVMYPTKKGVYINNGKKVVIK